LTAAGGVLYKQKKDKFEVLLIYRSGVWDLPKGKLEEGESIEDCARREVAEEVGISLPEIEARLTETYHEYRRDGKKYGKTTHWYKMSTDVQNSFTPEEQEGIEAVEWVDFDNALQRVGYENLEKVLTAFKNSD
jgi:8-oxo-dGTP pyrophosphatase MutT (NUDIX family)